MAAIVVDAAAFYLWNLATRSPAQLARDVAAARRPAAFARGVARLVGGFALLVIAFLIARPAFSTSRSFLFIQTGMLIAALVVENLIGPDIRGRRVRG